MGTRMWVMHSYLNAAADKADVIVPQSKVIPPLPDRSIRGLQHQIHCKGAPSRWKKKKSGLRRLRHFI
ncbi:hypothetical protein VZT92_011544 [Zoarces viviparus]|uniref:Uncharacterized protein n=1 Tax=Zoarces viviparus TaxID=48416 RepID=A0AAW1F6E5_ZOAVI